VLLLDMELVPVVLSWFGSLIATQQLKHFRNRQIDQRNVVDVLLETQTHAMQPRRTINLMLYGIESFG